MLPSLVTNGFDETGLWGLRIGIMRLSWVVALSSKWRIIDYRRMENNRLDLLRWQSKHQGDLLDGLQIGFSRR